MNGKTRLFLHLSRQSGSHGAGILADACSCAAALILRGVHMQTMFLYKGNLGGRWAWTRCVEPRLAERIRRLNGPEGVERFTDKAAFDARFSRFLGREWFCPAERGAEELGAFLRRHPDAVAKPRRGKAGRAVEGLRPPKDSAALFALHERLRAGDMLVEERLRQHPDLAALHASSVNTVRITTIRMELGPVLLAPALRMGRGGSLTDSFDAGGLSLTLDMASGRACGEAVDKLGRRWEFHPDSGAPLSAFTVPCWQEICAMVYHAARMAPEAPCVGWDVAVTPEGPVLMEGNARPSFAWQRADRRGWRREFLAAYQSARQVARGREAGFFSTLREEMTGKRRMVQPANAGRSRSA